MDTLLSAAKSPLRNPKVQDLRRLLMQAGASLPVESLSLPRVLVETLGKLRTLMTERAGYMIKAVDRLPYPPFLAPPGYSRCPSEASDGSCYFQNKECLIADGINLLLCPPTTHAACLRCDLCTMNRSKQNRTPKVVTNDYLQAVLGKI
jgi:hypothetical protein